MHIYILSSGRPTRQTTWNNLPDSLKERARIIVPIKEISAYRGYLRNIHPVNIQGIGPTRQWCIDQGGKVCMLDDDLTFAIRRNDDPTKFQNASDSQIKDMFDTIEVLLQNYAHGGVATREGGNRNSEDFLFNTRMLRVLAYNTDVLKKEKIHFDRLPVMEDFDVTLQLLEKGYQNCVINYIVQNQNGSNLLGGCSQYRTLALQEEAANKLAELHPGVVKVVKKKGWSSMEEERTDVIIQWKKAYSKCLSKS